MPPNSFPTEEERRAYLGEEEEEQGGQQARPRAPEVAYSEPEAAYAQREAPGSLAEPDIATQWQNIGRRAGEYDPTAGAQATFAGVGPAAQIGGAGTTALQGMAFGDISAGMQAQHEQTLRAIKAQQAGARGPVGLAERGATQATGLAGAQLAGEAGKLQMAAAQAAAQQETQQAALNQEITTLQANLQQTLNLSNAEMAQKNQQFNANLRAQIQMESDKRLNELLKMGADERIAKMQVDMEMQKLAKQLEFEYWNAEMEDATTRFGTERESEAFWESWLRSAQGKGSEEQDAAYSWIPSDMRLKKNISYAPPDVGEAPNPMQELDLLRRRKEERFGGITDLPSTGLLKETGEKIDAAKERAKEEVSAFESGLSAAKKAIGYGQRGMELIGGTGKQMEKGLQRELEGLGEESLESLLKKTPLEKYGVAGGVAKGAMALGKAAISGDSAEDVAYKLRKAELGAGAAAIGGSVGGPIGAAIGGSVGGPVGAGVGAGVGYLASKALNPIDEAIFGKNPSVSARTNQPYQRGGKTGAMGVTPSGRLPPPDVGEADSDPSKEGYLESLISRRKELKAAFDQGRYGTPSDEEAVDQRYESEADIARRRVKGESGPLGDWESGSQYGFSQYGPTVIHTGPDIATQSARFGPDEPRELGFPSFPPYDFRGSKPHPARFGGDPPPPDWQKGLQYGPPPVQPPVDAESGFQYGPPPPEFREEIPANPQRRGGPQGDLRDLWENVRAANFDYKDGPSDQTGVMAQDLEKSKIGKQIVEEGPAGAKHINTTKAVPPILAGISEAQADRDDLWSALDQLWQRVKTA